MGRHGKVHMALAVVVAMWGLVFVAIARLLPQLDTMQLVVIRFTLIALVFGVIFIVRPSTRPRFTGWRDLGVFVVMGVLAVPGAQLPIVNGQNYLSPPLVSLVVTTSPAFAAVIAALWLSERLSRRQAIGFVVALLGVCVVILAGSGGTSLEVDNVWGAGLTLLSPVSWALYTIFIKTITGRFDPFAAIGTTMITGSLAMSPLYPHAIDGLSDITATGWGWMAYLVIGGTVIPYMVWWWALSELSASSTTAYMYAIPLAALIWSFAILDIVPSAISLAGGAVVIAGVAMIQFKRRAEPESPAPGDIPAT